MSGEIKELIERVKGAARHTVGGQREFYLEIADALSRLTAPSDDLCQCPKCGRMHRDMGFGKPPPAPSAGTAEIEKRLNAATTPPWHNHDGWEDGAEGELPRWDVAVPGKQTICYVRKEADATFIAHAPTDIAALLALVKSLRAELATAKKDD